MLIRMVFLMIIISCWYATRLLLWSFAQCRQQTIPLLMLCGWWESKFSYCLVYVGLCYMNLELILCMLLAHPRRPVYIPFPLGIILKVLLSSHGLAVLTYLSGVVRVWRCHLYISVIFRLILLMLLKPFSCIFAITWGNGEFITKPSRWHISEPNWKLRYFYIEHQHLHKIISKKISRFSKWEPQFSFILNHSDSCENLDELTQNIQTHYQVGMNKTTFVSTKLAVPIVQKLAS